MEETSFQKLLNDTKGYINTRYELLRIEFLEKMSLIVALLIVIIVSTLLIVGAFVYFSLALAIAMQPLFGGSLIPPLLIIGGIFLVIVVILTFNRERFFVNPLIKGLSKILFNEKDTSEKQN